MHRAVMIILCNWKSASSAHRAHESWPHLHCAQHHGAILFWFQTQDLSTFAFLRPWRPKNTQNMGPTCDSVRHQFDLLQINQITSTHCCNMSATTCLPGISVKVENTTARWCVVCGKGANIGQHTSCVPVYALALLTLLPRIISLPSSKSNTTT